MTISEYWLFWPLAIVTVVSAATVLFARNPMNAAMALVVSFFGVAGIYVLLAAQLLAALQVIVYAGAIMVLFLFVIMLLSLTDADLSGERVNFRRITGALVAGSFAGLAFWAFRQMENQESMSMRVLRRGFGEVEEIGRLLFGAFVLPFEATSILLLVAIVGAVVVAKARI